MNVARRIRNTTGKLEGTKQNEPLKAIRPLSFWISSTAKLLLLSPLFCSFGFAQTLDERDILLGFNIHQKILATTPVLSEGDAAGVVGQVWRNMTKAQSYSGSPIQPQLFLMNSSVINAYSAGGGRLYVNSGLVEAVQGNAGIIAFVIGHEMAHNRLQHAIRRYLRAIQEDYNIKQAYRQNTWAGLAAETATRILEAKTQRDEEHEADRLGLMMAAEAGYHPDYAILADRQLRITAGESSKFAAFFEGHPRWTTREQRAEGFRAQAIAAFNRRWPDLASSPGGEPPTMVAIEDLKVAKDQKRKGIYHVSFFSDARNVKAAPVEITAIIVREKMAEPVTLDKKTYVASKEEQWNLMLDKKPKDKFGQRYLKVIATGGGNLLYESVLHKID